MDSNQAVIAAALRAYDPEMPVAQAEHAARLTAAALDHGGYAVVKRPTCGPPEEKTSGVVEPLVLEDLRRVVAATQDWSPVTIVQVTRPGNTLSPKRGPSVLTAVRGSLAAHRKRDLR
ncbi:hypothetical protein [Nocardia rhizosphaerae]|uniref:Uncharacterized protein n=1 Tax=Nocardia rhizosphaerae TaxID=1691571 RepID=A0ABV8LDW2_9NOCA